MEHKYKTDIPVELAIQKYGAEAFDYEIIDSQFIHVIIGQDWYVALDINGNIIHLMVDNQNQDFV